MGLAFQHMRACWAPGAAWQQYTALVHPQKCSGHVRKWLRAACSSAHESQGVSGAGWERCAATPAPLNVQGLCRNGSGQHALQHMRAWGGPEQDSHDALQPLLPTNDEGMCRKQILQYVPQDMSLSGL
eukprot:scaffold274712_cov17-Tisochrysis_lutea.AAC.1